jgi:hypothetical protein
MPTSLTEFQALLQQILWPVIIPGAFATLLLLAAWRPWRTGEDAERGDGAAWAFPAAAGIAFLVAFASQEWPVAFPFPQRWQAILLVGGACTAVALVASAIRFAPISLVVSAGGAAAVVAWLVDYGSLESGFSRVQLAIAAGAAVLVLEPLAVRRPGLVLPAVFWMAFTGLSVATLHGGFAKLSLMAAGLSAVGGAGIVAGMLQPRFRLARGGITVMAPMLVVLLATAWIYQGRSELGPWPWALLLAVPLLAWLGEVPLSGSVRAGEAAPVVTARRRFVADSVRVLLPLAAMLGAILVAISNAAPADEGSGGDTTDYESLYGG